MKPREVDWSWPETMWRKVIPALHSVPIEATLWSFREYLLVWSLRRSHYEIMDLLDYMKVGHLGGS